MQIIETKKSNMKAINNTNLGTNSNKNAGNHDSQNCVGTDMFFVCFTVYGHKNSNERRVLRDLERWFTTYEEAVSYAGGVDRRTAYDTMEAMADEDAIKYGDMETDVEGLSANIYLVPNGNADNMKLIDFCVISQW